MSPKCPKPANAEHRLAELGIELAPAPTPLGAYVESVQTGNLLYLSGILPVIGHEPKFVGRLGREYNVEQGREAAHGENKDDRLSNNQRSSWFNPGSHEGALHRQNPYFGRSARRRLPQ